MQVATRSLQAVSAPPRSRASWSDACGVLVALGVANALLLSLGREPWPLLPHPPPEWLAGKLTDLWGGVRRAMLRRRQQARALP